LSKRPGVGATAGSSEEHCDELACVYVTDGAFLPCTCFSIATLAKNICMPFHAYVMHDAIDAIELAKAASYLASIGAPTTFVAIPPSAFDDLPRPQSLPVTTYGRLLMHRLLPDKLARVLYLDGDTLVDIDVAPLASVPLSGRVIGAVVDVGRILVGRRQEARQRLGLGPDGDYFNAGVMLIDWPQWQSRRIGEQCLRALVDEPQRFTQKDQCALNFVCRGQWKQLDLIWNYQPACVTYDDRDTALFHFLGGRKPWRAGHQRHPMRFAKRYRELYLASPWATQFEDSGVPYTLRDMIRIAKRTLSPRFWKNRWLYRELARQSSG
jgi:lipopolysaccharide biosynthesis glycosyltransferase